MKRFERSNGLDTALYKKLPFYRFKQGVMLVLLICSRNIRQKSCKGGLHLE